MKKNISRFLIATLVISAKALSADGATADPDYSDAGNFRYRIEPKSVFNSRNAMEAQRIDSLIVADENQSSRTPRAHQNPEPLLSLPPSDIIGDLEAPDGEMWSYIGNFEYLEIPPHDNVMFTERLLQEYTFTIYDSEMNVLGTIKDKIHYKDGERRAPLCELTPVVTRNFFNTDDEIELMVAVGINPAVGYGVHYHSYVYRLGGEKDDNGYDTPIMIFNNMVGDIIEGPRSADGSDNFYFTFSGGTSIETRSDSSFWDRLVSMGSTLSIKGDTVTAEGEINVFTADGKLVAQGYSHLNLSTLAKGMYILTTKDASIKLIR